MEEGNFSDALLDKIDVENSKAMPTNNYKIYLNMGK